MSNPRIAENCEFFRIQYITYVFLFSLINVSINILKRDVLSKTWQMPLQALDTRNVTTFLEIPPTVLKNVTRDPF